MQTIHIKVSTQMNEKNRVAKKSYINEAEISDNFFYVYLIYN